MINVKCGNITSLNDARYFAAKRVDYITFDPHTISSEKIHALKEWIEGPQIVIILKEESEMLQWGDYMIQIKGENISNFSTVEKLNFIDCRGSDLSLFRKITAITEVPLILYMDQFSDQAVNNPIYYDFRNNSSFLRKNLNKTKDLNVELSGAEEKEQGFMDYENMDEIFEIIDEAG